MVIGKGMGALIAGNVEAVHQRILDEAEGVETNDTYDPLMASCWRLMGTAIQDGGLDLMCEKSGTSQGGQCCPLCEVEAVGVRVEGKPGLATVWLEGCTDSVLVYCREQGLLAKPQ